jgi:hypothetical protein
VRIIAKANDSTADEPQSSEMSLENALKVLGVGEGASFEEILRAKKMMMDRSGGDEEQVRQVIILLTLWVLSYELFLVCVFFFFGDINEKNVETKPRNPWLTLLFCIFCFFLLS